MYTSMKLMLQKLLSVIVFSQLQKWPSALMAIIIFPSKAKNSIIVSDSKLFPLRLTPCSAVCSQMPPPQGTQSLGWLTAPSRPATASGLSQSRCLCTPRSSPLSMKVRVCYIAFSPSSAALFVSNSHLCLQQFSSYTLLVFWWYRMLFHLKTSGATDHNWSLITAYERCTMALWIIGWWTVSPPRCPICHL